MPLDVRRPRPRRIRKMPHHLRLVRGTYQVQLSVPRPLQEVVPRVTGHPKPVQAWLIRSTRTGNLREAERRRDDQIIPEFRRILKEAERRCDPVMLAAHWINPKIATLDAASSATARRIAPLGMEYGGTPAEQESTVRALLNGYFDRQDEHVERLDDLTNQVRHALSRPLSADRWDRMRTAIFAALVEPTPSESDPVNYEMIIDLWAAERQNLPKAVRTMKQRMARLFAFLGAGRCDMASVTPEELIRYKETLLADPGLKSTTVEDHLIYIKALFRFAFGNCKIPNNPAAGLRYTGHTDPRDERLDFDEADIRLILTRAREAAPVIRWSNWLAAYCGARLAEIVEADARDVVIEDAVPVLHIRLDHRPATMRLKTRGRRFPIHDAVIREGFLDYVQSLPPGPLFPEIDIDSDGRRNREASRIIISWLRDIGITERRKDFHSWRHTFKTTVRGRIDEEFHDYITGHANGKVGRDYGFYPISKLVPEIGKIPDFLAS